MRHTCGESNFAWAIRGMSKDHIKDKDLALVGDLLWRVEAYK